MIDQYKTAKRAAAEYAVALRQCDHPKDIRRINVGITWEPDRIEVCTDCWHRAKSLGTEYNAELKRGRKAQLDAMPRCEIDGCKRRGTARWGWGPDRALLCGRHGKAAQRQHVRTMTVPGLMLGLTMSRKQIMALAVEGLAR